jgi:hypothetical protein
MKLIDLTQGTEEWLEYRRSRVTATDFCIVAADAGLCENIFSKSLNTLIKEKTTGVLQKDNKYFAMGRHFEPILMQGYKGVDLVTSQIGLYSKNLRIMSSFDGIDWFADRVIEIKTTSKSKDERDKIIKYYSYQVAHQCYTSELDAGIIIIGWLQDGELSEIETIEVKADKIISKSEWLRLCKEFIVKLDAASQAPTESISAWEKYNNLDIEIKKLKQQQEEYKQQLILAHPRGATFSQFSVVESTRTSCKYAEYIKELDLVVPEQYKTTTTSLQIKNNLKGKDNDNNLQKAS